MGGIKISKNCNTIKNHKKNDLPIHIKINCQKRPYIPRRGKMTFFYSEPEIPTISLEVPIGAKHPKKPFGFLSFLIFLRCQQFVSGLPPPKITEGRG